MHRGTANYSNALFWKHTEVSRERKEGGVNFQDELHEMYGKLKDYIPKLNLLAAEHDQGIFAGKRQ